MTCRPRPVFENIPCIFPVSRESRFRDRFAEDWLVNRPDDENARSRVSRVRVQSKDFSQRTQPLTARSRPKRGSWVILRRIITSAARQLFIQFLTGATALRHKPICKPRPRGATRCVFPGSKYGLGALPQILSYHSRAAAPVGIVHQDDPRAELCARRLAERQLA